MCPVSLLLVPRQAHHAAGSAKVQPTHRRKDGKSYPYADSKTPLREALKGRYFVKRAGKRIRLVGVAGKKGGDPWVLTSIGILGKEGKKEAARQLDLL